VYAHTYEELEAQNILLRKQLAHEVKVAHEAVFQQEKENARLSLELDKTWGWKKKVGTFVAGLAIGWIVAAQGGRLPNNNIRGATTSKATL
jgi:hypothetical protein